MITMVPILARNTHYHKLISLVGFTAVTKIAKMVLAIFVQFIFMVQLVWIELASCKHAPISTVAPELKSLSQVHQIMPHMTCDSTSYTYPMRLSVWISSKKLTEICKSCSFFLVHVTCFAGKHLLQNIALFIPTFLDKL